ncbi:hypothetical protein [Sphingopyxis sp. C-1]|uniref:hypothetical protein n=1 Tax=Sphingopyxis sp. C-1 TaxID=262667 RepID=UPI00128BBD1E|nr:hypothetical protein [Sphingopyxis sp. C-1]
MRIEESLLGWRELDEEIFRYLGWEPIPNPTWSAGLGGRWRRGEITTGSEGAPFYTKSIDDAVMLISTGCEWSYDSHYKVAKVFRYVFVDGQGPDCLEFEGEGNSAAMSICVAALRERGAAE